MRKHPARLRDPEQERCSRAGDARRPPFAKGFISMDPGVTLRAWVFVPLQARTYRNFSTSFSAQLNEPLSYTVATFDPRPSSIGTSWSSRTVVAWRDGRSDRAHALLPADVSRGLFGWVHGDIH